MSFCVYTNLYLLDEVHLVVGGLFYAAKSVVELSVIHVRCEIGYQRGIRIVAYQTDACLVLHSLTDCQVVEDGGQCTDYLKILAVAIGKLLFATYVSLGRNIPCLRRWQPRR